jgi:poly-gamma-glutamate capsule biosynthesis protein CapA/YwtB (metallophosphatase superfamily)
MKKTSIFILLTSFLLHNNISASNCDTVKLVFIGDVMQHTKQIDLAKKNNYNYNSYFRYIKKWIDSSDFAVANMEFTIGVTPFSGYPSFSVPTAILYEADRSGIDLFLCANNHICDRGKKGLDSTYSAYTRKNLNFTGLYTSKEEEIENNPFIVTISNIKIAFINFTYGTNGIPVSQPYIVNKMDTIEVKKSISRAKERGADFIIILPHWGEEYTLTPSSEQQRWRTFLLKEGADAIVGGHPHTIQPTVPTYDEHGNIANLTLYSLGNYISNMSAENTQLGLLFELTIIKNCSSNETYIEKYNSVPLWCALEGTFDENYTTIPILEYIDKEGAFRSNLEYSRMKKTYNNLKHIVINGK